MKKFFLCALSFVALSLIMASCGDGNDPNAIKLSKNAERIGLAGGSVKIELTSPSAWSATASEDWVTINPSSGPGDAFVTITVAPGTKGTATIIFTNDHGSVKMAIARSDDEGDTPPDPQEPTDPNTPQDENIPSPTGLTAQTVAHAQCEYRTVQVNLSWNKVAGATSYKVYREDICQEQEPWAGLVIGQVMVANRLIATVTEPSYTDSADPYHTPNTGAWPTHMDTKYTITAITSKGESKPSDAVTVEWENGECFH